MIVYKVTNLTNGKIYVGQTVRTLKQRWNSHCVNKSKTALAHAIKKHGKENFKMEPIVRASSIEELNHREQFCIKMLNTMAPNGYNLRTGGLNSLMSQESRQKMSDSAKGKKRNRSKKVKIKKKVEGWINPQIGKSVTQNSIIKNALSHGAKPFIVKSKEGRIVWQGLVMAQCAKELQLSVGNISQCLAGKRKQHKGFTFEAIDG